MSIDRMSVRLHEPGSRSIQQGVWFMKTFAFSVSIAAGTILAALLLAGTPASAVEYPWCLRSAGFASSGKRCDFSTLEQCQAVYAYSNGWCERNSRFVGQEQPVPQRGR